MFLIIF